LRTKEMMNLHVRDCLVVGYEDLIDKIKLKDPKDRHVVAAAIVGRADLIVTFNIRDFDKEVLAKYKLHAQTPDDFLLHIYSLASNAVVDAARTIG
jgi:predicted nucleic acid-binding protein